MSNLFSNLYIQTLKNNLKQEAQPLNLSDDLSFSEASRKVHLSSSLTSTNHPRIKLVRYTIKWKQPTMTQELTDLPLGGTGLCLSRARHPCCSLWVQPMVSRSSNCYTVQRGPAKSESTIHRKPEGLRLMGEVLKYYYKTHECLQPTGRKEVSSLVSSPLE